MSSRPWFTLTAWVFVPIAAIAQEKHTLPLPADAAAPVTPIVYESAFNAYRPYRDDGGTPDGAWRSANEAISKLGGHDGQREEAASQAAGATPSAPARNGAADHSRHH